MTTRKIIVSALISAMAGGAQLANATDVFRLEGFGAISRGMGGTAAAHDVGPAGMMSNPATLSLMPEGDQVLVGLDIVTTNIDVTNQINGEKVSSSNESNNRGPYYAPEVAYTKRMGPWAFGVGAFAQGGLGTEYGNQSFLSQASGGINTGLPNSSRLLVLDIPFAVSYQATEDLSIGGSIDAKWQGLNLDLLLAGNQVGSLLGSGRVNGSLVPVLGGLPDLRGAHFSLTRDQPLASGVDSWGFGARIGAVYRANSDTRIGGSFEMQSQMSDMSGNATLTAVDGVAGQIPLGGKITVKDFQMPSILNLGISHRITPQWLVAADISEVFWKNVMKNINVAFEASGGGNLNISLPQDYKNQTIFSIGTAYDVNPDMVLRAGFRVASQALPSSTLFAVIPAIPVMHLSLGASYKFTKQSILDFAYSHAFEETMTNSSLPNTSVPIEVSHSQNNFTISYRYSF
jgi:long-chain fatty acid transport protein